MTPDLMTRNQAQAKEAMAAVVLYNWPHWGLVKETVIKEYSLAAEDFPSALLEYLQFLADHARSPGAVDVTNVSCSVKLVWYSHILNLKHYLQFCEEMWGYLIYPVETNLVPITSNLQHQLKVVPHITEEEDRALNKISIAKWDFVESMASMLYGLTKHEFDAACQEYQKFLALSIVNTGSLSMFSYFVDKIWHSHILVNLEDYLRFCLDTFGYIIFHVPTLPSQPASDKNGVKRFKQYYQSTFGTLLPAVWYAKKGGGHLTSDELLKEECEWIVPIQADSLHLAGFANLIVQPRLCDHAGQNTLSPLMEETCINCNKECTHDDDYCTNPAPVVPLTHYSILVLWTVKIALRGKLL